MNTQLTTDKRVLEAALIGLHIRHREIEEKAAAVKSMLAGVASPERPTHGRKLSAATRKRMAEAQRRRWARVRKEAK